MYIYVYYIIYIFIYVYDIYIYWRVPSDEWRFGGDGGVAGEAFRGGLVFKAHRLVYQ